MMTSPRCLTEPFFFFFVGPLVWTREIFALLLFSRAFFLKLITSIALFLPLARSRFSFPSIFCCTSLTCFSSFLPSSVQANTVAAATGASAPGGSVARVRRFFPETWIWESIAADLSNEREEEEN